MDDGLANRVKCRTCSCKTTNMCEKDLERDCHSSRSSSVMSTKSRKDLSRCHCMASVLLSVFHILQRSASKLGQQLAPKERFVIFISIFPATKMAAGSEEFTENEALAALAPGRLNEFWNWIEYKICEYWIKTVSVLHIKRANDNWDKKPCNLITLGKRVQ